MICIRISRRRRRSVRSVWSPRLGRSGPMVVWSGGCGGSIYGYVHGPSTSTGGASRGGLSHQQGARYSNISIYIYMYYILGPAALIVIFPSFWVRLGATETIDVSHVRVNVGRGGLKRCIPNASLQVVDIFLQI